MNMIYLSCDFVWLLVVVSYVASVTVIVNKLLNCISKSFCALSHWIGAGPA